MKKLILSIFLLTLYLQANAQLGYPKENIFNQIPLSDFNTNYSRNNIPFAVPAFNKTNFIHHYFMNFSISRALLYIKNNQGTSNDFFKFVNTNLIPVFPDSTVKNQTSATTFTYIHTHKLGMVIDPASPVFGDSIDRWTPYLIDSIYVAGVYNVVNGHFLDHPDTLMVEIVWGNHPTSETDNSVFQTLRKIATINNQKIPFLADCIMNTPKSAQGNPGNVNAPLGSHKKIVKYLLTKHDSAVGDNGKGINIPLGGPGIHIPAGNIVGIAVTFIPGYVYHPNDIYYSQDGGTPATLNSFWGIYFVDKYKPANGSTYLFSDDVKNGHCSTSQLLDARARYGTNKDTILNQSFFPNWDLGINMGFYITADITGINENLSNGLTLAQNRPNPFSGNTTIEYSIKESSAVKLEIVDITGKKLMTVDEGKKTAGNHSLIINADKLSSGLYFYTLIANGSRLTRKMNIVN